MEHALIIAAVAAAAGLGYWLGYRTGRADAEYGKEPRRSPYGG